MTDKQQPPEDKVGDIQGAVKETTADPEALETPVKFVIIPGKTTHEGQPSSYFVRTEGTIDTLRKDPESLEYMLDELFGQHSETTDFIVGINGPDAAQTSAEAMKEKLNDPAMQQRIRRQYEQQKKLRLELKGY